jgi:hypothetical protein
VGNGKRELALCVFALRKKNKKGQFGSVVEPLAKKDRFAVKFPEIS